MGILKLSRCIKRLVRCASGREEAAIGARALPYFWVEARLFFKSFLFWVAYNVLFDRLIVFRFFQVVFSVFSASFQFHFSDSARAMFNVFGRTDALDQSRFLKISFCLNR